MFSLGQLWAKDMTPPVSQSPWLVDTVPTLDSEASGTVGTLWAQLVVLHGRSELFGCHSGGVAGSGGAGHIGSGALQTNREGGIISKYLSLFLSHAPLVVIVAVIIVVASGKKVQGRKEKPYYFFFPYVLFLL